MCVACWVPKAKNTHSEYVIIIVFHCNSGYTKAPHYYIIWTDTACLVKYQFALRALAFLWPCIVSKVWREKNQQDATIRCCLLLTSVSTCFGHHYAHIQENKCPVTASGVLFWLCWMWLVAVVRRCLVLASYNASPHNRHQPQPAEPEQYTKCSNGFFVLLKIGIMVPETCWDRS